MAPPRIPSRSALGLDPALILSAQEGGRIDAATPERRLMLAVLADAIYTYRRAAGATDASGRRLFAETADWFASSSTADPFAFLTLCDALGFDAAYMRSRLGRGGTPRLTRRRSEIAVTPPARAAG